MAVVTSTAYPNLWVHDLGVRFVDGVADVKDAKVLAILAGIDGVEVSKAATKPKPAEPDE